MKQLFRTSSVVKHGPHPTLTLRLVATGCADFWASWSPKANVPGTPTSFDPIRVSSSQFESVRPHFSIMSARLWIPQLQKDTPPRQLPRKNLPFTPFSTH